MVTIADLAAKHYSAGGSGLMAFGFCFSANVPIVSVTIDRN